MTAPRILIVVTHLLGTGHLARMAAIARVAADRGAAVTLVSGGRAAPMVNMTGLHVVHLPALHCTGAKFHMLLDDTGGPASGELMERRRVLLLEAFDRSAPDVLVTELYPFGRRALREEFETLLSHARAAQPRPVIVSSIRDILNPPSRPDRVTHAMDRMGACYDKVLFHGDSAFAPLEASWPIAPPLRRRMIETGYVRDAAQPVLAPPLPHRCFLQTDEERTHSIGEIVVSAGGSAAGAALWQAALEAAPLLPDRPWRLLIGHGVSEADFHALVRGAGANVVVERARSDFVDLLSRADLSISQAGYNTVLDLAAAGARALLVPFAEGAEREQGLRAQALAERGLAAQLAQDLLSGQALAEAAKAALARPRPDWSALQLDGAGRSADLLIDLAGSAHRRAAAWNRLEAALAQAERMGRVLPFWLRDDDVVAESPALSRFLAQLAAHAIPAAFAAIPATVQDGLAAILAPTRHAVLTHGWSHRNHAPEHEKKVEFGGGRDMRVMLDEAERGRERLSRLFGTRALPVFVPPWNRIDHDFTRGLADAGFSGLSTYGRRSHTFAARLTQVNTHWDPVDWRSGGGLSCEAVLIERLAALIDEELAAPSFSLEPIGLLTHHLVHDAWIERFLDEVLSRLIGSPAVRFLHPAEVFGGA